MKNFQILCYYAQSRVISAYKTKGNNFNESHCKLKNWEKTIEQIWTNAWELYSI